MEKPFYFKKNTLSIYEDKIELPKANKVILLSNVDNIKFGKMDFGTTNNFYVIFNLKSGESLEFLFPPSAYFALKKFREKGIKSDGKRETLLLAAQALIILLALGSIIFFLSKLGS